MSAVRKLVRDTVEAVERSVYIVLDGAGRPAYRGHNPAKVIAHERTLLAAGHRARTYKGGVFLRERRPGGRLQGMWDGLRSFLQRSWNWIRQQLRRV